MVTLRRDVAAANNNTVFDRVDRDVELTDYDIFMRNRERSASMNYGSEFVGVSYDSYSATATLGYRYDSVEEPKASTAYESYDEYMRAQLNRNTISKLLTKEEFYQKKFHADEGGAVARPAKGRMSKACKIFTAVYVLTVVVAALIMVIVNASAGGHKVSANADAATGEIQALNIESYEIEGNAFDDFLDKISNK